MPASPLISIIMPVYNAAGFLTRAVQSAQSQTYANIEILLIDDCSTDDTFEVAQDIAKTDSRIRVFKQAKNGGPSAARNRGLTEAKGEWITLLDDDDAYHPQRIETLLTSATVQQADMVFDNLTMFDPQSGKDTGFAIPPQKRSSGSIDLAGYVKACSPFHQGVKFANLKAFFKKSIAIRHNLTYSESYRYGEDLNFYLELFLTGANAYYIQEPYYIYTMQVSQSGQKSPFTRTVQDTSQLVEATRTTLEKWSPSVSSAEAALVKHRLKELSRFQTFTLFKQHLKHKRLKDAACLLVKNSFLIKLMAGKLMAKLFPRT